MVVLLDPMFRARTIAASMAIEKPKAIDGAPCRGRSGSGGWQTGDFFVSRGMAGLQGPRASRGVRTGRGRKSIGAIAP